MKHLIPYVAGLVTLTSFGQSFDVDTLYFGGNAANRLNIVLVGDGYDSTEQAKQIVDLTASHNKLFNTTPYKEYKPFFNSVAIKVISNESGAKHPNTATDCPSGAGYIPTTDPDNYFGSSFDEGFHRCLYINNFLEMFNVLVANYPMYDKVGVIANSPYYGGCGGGYAVASAHSSSADIMIHEFGHSLGGLGDEYDYGNCFASSGKNWTTQTDSALVPWNVWFTPGVPIPTPGGQYCSSIALYEGAHYCTSGVYRPKCSCMMRSLGPPFCEVCREHLIRVFHQYVNLIESSAPASNEIDWCAANDSITFTATIVQNVPQTIRTRWLLDGILQAVGTTSFDLRAQDLVPGVHQLTLEVQDTTPWVRMQPVAPDVKTWTIKVGTVPIVTVSFADSVCGNDAQVSLMASPPGGVFSGNGVSGDTFDPQVSGIGPWTVQYTYTDSVGCDYSASQVINVLSVPAVTIDAPDSLCLSDMPAVIVAQPSGGTLSGAGIADSTFSPSVAGVGSHVIEYIYTDSLGCSDTATTEITVLECGVGIRQASQRAMHITPNPAGDIVSIQLPDGSFTVDVISSDGRWLLRVVEVSGDALLDVSSWAPGLYLVRLRGADATPVTAVLVVE